MSVSLVATAVVGGIAFAALGGIDVLGFGSESQAAFVNIVETTPATTVAVILGAVAVDTTTTVAGAMPPEITAIAPVGNGSAAVANPGSTRGTAPNVTTPNVTTPNVTTPGPTTPGPTTPGPTTPGPTTPGPTTPGPTAATTPATAAPTVPPTVAPTTPTTPRTTAPPATTAPPPPPASTLPAGVPKDWPSNKPIPPKPEGCVSGQLEDNGVWNCQH